MQSHFRMGGSATGRLSKAPQIQLCFVVCLMLTSACHRQAPSASVIASAKQINPQPPRVGPVSVTFHLENSGKPLTGAQVVLEADMSHAGMAPVFASARELSQGNYQGQLELGMAGDWVVLMHITLPDGQTAEEQMNVNGVTGK